jgi:hypothetical protein
VDGARQPAGDVLTVARLLGRPALHFVVIGTALFVLERRFAPPPAATGPAEVVIPATRIVARERRFARDTGRVPTADERAALVRETVDEELLYREAIARALDRDDRSIRGHLAEKMRFLDPASEEVEPPVLARRAIALGLDRSDAFVRRVLVEKMRLLTGREGEEVEPDDATLAAFMAEHAERWRLPARATVQHVFLRDPDPARAAALLARLRAGTADFARSGDPFHTGPVVPDAARPTLVNLFGEAIAEHALAAPLGKWSGPLRSPWGVHLVRIEARTAPALPAVAEVRRPLLVAWREQGRRARERAALERLRQRWNVRVEGVGA